MFQKIKIAMRNLMRHRYRTFLTGAIISIIAFIFVFGLSVSEGISEGLIEKIIRLNTGHVIITSIENKNSSDESAENVSWDKQKIENVSDIENELIKYGEVNKIARRLKITGIVASDIKTGPCIIVGIEPDKEPELLLSDLEVKEGEFLPLDKKDNSIYISSTIAEVYNAGVGDNLTLICQTENYASNSIDFKVCGIFKESSWKEYYSYVYLSDAQSLAGIEENTITHLKVTLDRREDSEYIAKKINENIGNSYGIYARDWRTASEMLLGTVMIMEVSVYGMCVILFFLIGAILINNISMAIHERTNEIGILMAMGMTGKGIYSLFLWETFILSSIFIFVGELIGCILSVVLGNIGIPAFTEVLKLSFGADYTYPILRPEFVILSAGIILLLSILLTIIPIKKAVKLDPAEAVRVVN